eukprot:PITA_25891
MTGKKEKPHSYNALEKEKYVSFRNDTPAIIKGQDFVFLKEKVKARNVMYVNGLKQNLLSVSQMCDQGSQVVFQSNRCVVLELDIGETVMKGCSLSSNDEIAAVHQPTYRSMIASLLYLTGTRPDIMHAVGIVGRFQAKPKESHLQAVKRIFKYPQGTQDFGLWHPRNVDLTLHAYTDVELLWMMQTLQEIQITCSPPISIICDNTSAIIISNNPVMHSKTKHIPIKYHFLREQVLDKKVKLEYVPSKE